MAYQLKQVQYKDNCLPILLQNENGPCPLLAAVNALLLQGIIELPSFSLRANEVTIETLITVCADRALTHSGLKHNQKQEQGQTEHQINELMQLLPHLQHGMDLNPKFTSGPEGYEYTKNLIAFDCMGVELVHGWLIDTTATQTARHTTMATVIGTKSYNELIEMVVKGNDMEEQARTLNQLIQTKTKTNTNQTNSNINQKNANTNTNQINTNTNINININTNLNQKELEHGTKIIPNHNHDKDDTITIPLDTNTDIIDATNCANDSWVTVSEPEPDEQVDSDGSSENYTHIQMEDASSEDASPIQPQENQMNELTKQLHDLDQFVTNAKIVALFLEETGHQLTTFGLKQLHEHVQEGDLCVFFRNNHFSTMTKFEGQLFLLVTDLGYATVSDVVWEKLDAIDGNTDYVNDFFFKPKARDDYILDTTPTTTDIPSSLTPVPTVAHSGTSDTDYQLAVHLSNEATNEDHDSNPTDRDRQIALSIQRQFQEQDASERLAQQLHAEETRTRQHQIEKSHSRHQTRRTNDEPESNCILS